MFEVLALLVAQQLTFQEAVGRALAHNPSVVSATQTVVRAQALLDQARAGRFPTLTGNATLTRLDQERVLDNGTTRRVIVAQDQQAANVQLAVPILAPAAMSQSHRARDAVKVAQADAVEVQRQIALTAARTWLGVLSQRRVLEAAERARATAKAHFDYAHTRLLGGVGRSLDEVRAAQELAVSESQVEAAHAGLARAREALGVAIGADAAADVADEEAVGETPPSLTQGLEEAATSRLDVAAARTRLGAARNSADHRWTSYAPYVTAVVTPFFQHPSTLTSPELGWQAQLVLTLPIYDGGRRKATFREQDANIVDARAQLDGQLREARAEVRAGFEAMVRADRSLAAARQAVQLARKSLELATLAYQAGATSNLEVIDAERRARDAETAAAVAEDTARMARLDLLAASGRFPPRR